MKKLLNLLLVTLLVCTLATFFGASTSAETSDAIKINVSSGEVVVNNTVDVTISVENNPGISSLKIKVQYDELLTLTNVTFNESFVGDKSTPPEYVNPQTLAVLSPLNETTSNGVLATLTFKVADTTVKEGYLANISVTYDEDDVFDMNFDNIPLEITNGYLTVYNGLPGDINADGSVNAKDAVLLYRYVADWGVTVDMAAVDVNGDGKANAKDAVLLYRYVADWEGIELVRKEFIVLEEYTVTFDGDGGTLVSGEEEQVITHGNSAIAPTYEKYGYEFAGWDCDFDNVTSDMTVTALWEEAQYTVTFDGDGGTLIDGEEEQIIAHGGLAIAPTYEKYGYEFAGWDCEFDNVTSDITVTALWSNCNYTVTYNLNGGENTALSEGTVVEYGDLLAKPTEIPVKDGWEFIGWTEGSWYNTLYDFDEEVCGDITLNAMYAPKADETYRITLDNNVSGQYTHLTSAINPTLEAGEQVILQFDINEVYSTVSRFMVSTMDIAHSRENNWWAYNGVDTEYAHNSYYYATAGGVFDNYSGMSAGSGKVAYDASGMVNGVEHWVADDGWYLTGGKGYPNDKCRLGSIPFGEGKSVKLVYTAPIATKKASLCLYTKATVDGDSAYVLNSAIMDIPANRSDLARTVMFSLDTNVCLDMNVSNLSCTTSNGQNLGVQIITTAENNVGTIELEEFKIENPNTKTYSIEVTNNATTTGFGGADVLSFGYGESLVYEFDVVESNLGVQDVNEDGDMSDNATSGWFGVGMSISGSVSNWPWKMMYTNGSNAGIGTNNFASLGTAEYPMYGSSAESHWWRLMETGANVKVVFTRTESGASNGSFIIYKNGEVFVSVTGLGDITGTARINFMWYDAGPRVLKVTNLYSYTQDVAGNKMYSTSALGTCSLVGFVEIDA